VKVRSLFTSTPFASCATISKKPPAESLKMIYAITFCFVKMSNNGAGAPSRLLYAASNFSSKKPFNANGRPFCSSSPGAKKKLPVVLSHDEVRNILNCVRLLRYRVCLTTIYSCGLRLTEAINMKVEDVDSARGLLCVHGKCSKDRYVPLPNKTLTYLREQWKSHTNPVWIFPSAKNGESAMTDAQMPISKGSVQSAFRAALKQSGISKKASVHTLRHYVEFRIMLSNIALIALWCLFYCKFLYRTLLITRHNYRLLRKARSWSSGRYLGKLDIFQSAIVGTDKAKSVPISPRK